MAFHTQRKKNHHHHHTLHLYMYLGISIYLFWFRMFVWFFIFFLYNTDTDATHRHYFVVNVVLFIGLIHPRLTQNWIRKIALMYRMCLVGLKSRASQSKERNDKSGRITHALSHTHTHDKHTESKERRAGEPESTTQEKEGKSAMNNRLSYSVFCLLEICVRESS